MIVTASWKIFIAILIAFAGGYFAKCLERYCDNDDYVFRGDVDNMGTSVRTELSKNNKFYIPKWRRLELKYYCMQISDLLKQYDDCVYICKRYAEETKVDPTNKRWSSVEEAAEMRDILSRRINPFAYAANDIARLYGEEVASMVQCGVQNNVNYDILVARTGITSCSKRKYYKAYHQFFYILDKYRN